MKLKEITDFSERNVRALLRKRSVSLTRDSNGQWVVTSDAGLCEVVSTLREAYFAAQQLGKYED